MFRRLRPASKPEAPRDVGLAACKGEVVEALVRQEVDAANALLANVVQDVRVRVELGCVSAGAAVPQWTADGRESLFSFHPTAYESFPQEIFRRWFEWLPIPLRLMRAAPVSGSCRLNLGDEGHCEGLAFCDNRPEYLLAPDFMFLGYRGYAGLVAESADVRFRDRRPVAFWRGSTTGRRTGGVLDLPRVRLCVMAKAMGQKADVGLSSMVLLQPEEEELLRGLDLLADYRPMQELGHYQVQIDIDGHTNSWPGLLAKLHSGSPVLKVQSPFGFRQWYYDRLIPWENYIPVRSDMSDLEEKIDYLLANPRRAEEIGQRGQALARRMTYEREIEAAIPVASAALRAGRAVAA